MEGDDTTSKANKVDDDHHTTSTTCPAHLPNIYDAVAAHTTDEEDEEFNDINNNNNPVAEDEDMKDFDNNVVAENSMPVLENEEKGIDNLMAVREDVEKMKDGDDLESSDSDEYIGGGYPPPADFEEVFQGPLIDIDGANDDIELWLIEFPSDLSLDDIEGGQTVSFELDNEDGGPIGSIKMKSGKVYRMVNFPAPVAEVTVFNHGLSGVKVAGKISRYVNLVCFPEPDDELVKQCEEKAASESESESSSEQDSSNNKHECTTYV